MDKQKDFIHIDDVFKGVRQGEEKEKSGSWLQMKDLLDKELPLGASVGNPGYRRYLLPIMALLLLGGGAYYMHNQSDQNNKLSPINALNPHQISSTNEGNAKNKTIPDLQTADKSPAKPKQSHSSTTEPSSVATKTTQNPVTSATITGSNRPSGQRPDHNHQAASKTILAKAIPASENGNTTLPKKEAAPTSAFATGSAENHFAGNTKQPKNIKSSDELPVIQENHIIETLKPKSTSKPAKSIAGNHSEVNPDASAEKEWAPLAFWKGSSIVSNKNNHLYKEERDTFISMSINRKLPAKPGPDYRDRIELDTVSIARIERIRYTPLSPVERMELMHANLLPAAYWAAISPNSALASITQAEQVNVVPLSAYKVSSKKARTNTIGALKNTATGLASVFDGTKKWYAAILLGGNTSIGNPSAYGMQFGIAALFAFAERWTLSAELKYQNGYFSNFQFLDNTSTFDVNEQQYGSGWIYQGKEYKTSNNYAIKSKANLNMPILLSYNLGRISVFGGPEFAYFYPLTWTKEKHTETINVSQTSPTHTNPFVNSPLLLNEKTDFNSRFGMGYIFGLSYDFSRKVSLDARVSQMLWDNSGKYKIDALRNVYHLPTAELSIGFYFGRRDKVIYILDRKK